MRTAIFDGVEVRASAQAPRRARCPVCGERVNLWPSRNGRSWFYRHARRAGPQCTQRARPAVPEDAGRRPVLVRGDPELTLAVHMVNHVAGAALEGDAGALAWLLEHPLPRTTLTILGINADVALKWLAAQVEGDNGSNGRARPSPRSEGDKPAVLDAYRGRGEQRLDAYT